MTKRSFLDVPKGIGGVPARTSTCASPARCTSRVTRIAALCACLCWAGLAHAESDMALYGELDMGLTYANPVAADGAKPSHRVAATSGNVTGSFIGLRGSEALGGDLSAIFTIERGIDVTNGTAVEGQPMFVGLSHSVWGTLTLGLQNDAINDYLAPLTLTGSDGGTYFAHPFDSDNANASLLSSHTVKWASPEWAGARLGAQYALAPDVFGKRDWSAGGAYANGPLSLGLGYARYGMRSVDGEPDTIIGGWQTTTAMTARPERGVAYEACKIGRDIYGGGVNYVLGDATLGAVYTHVRYQGLAHATTRGVARLAGRVDLDNYELNARYDVTPAVKLAAGFTHTRGASHAGAGVQRTAWNQIGVHANYAMSRRTDVYVEGVHQRVVDDRPVAFINGIGPSGGDQMSALAMGVRHRF